MRSWIPASLVFVALLVISGSAHAQRESRVDREARALFEAGQEAFGSGNYPRALEYFDQAYALSERSGLLYNIAVTADRMRNDARALEAFRAYLAAEPDTERRAEVEARIAFLEAAQTTTTEPDPTTDPPTTDPPVTTPPPASSGGIHPAGIGVLIGAGALFVSFAIFAGLSEAEDQSLASSCGRDRGGVCTPSQVGTLETFNLVADISWIAGSIAAVAGVVLLFVLPAETERADTQAASLTITPWASPQGAGIGAVGTW